MTRPPPLDLPEFLSEASADADAAPLSRALVELGLGSSAPPQLLRERLLATVLRPRLRYAPFFGALSRLFDLGDSELASVFERAASASEWVSAPIPGTELLHLQGGPAAAQADNGLVRIQAGTRFPMHRHVGREQVLVLAGGYRDEQSGHAHLPGDLHEMPAGSAHSYVALPGEPLLLAVSLVGGIEIEGLGTLSASPD